MERDFRKEGSLGSSQNSPAEQLDRLGAALAVLRVRLAISEEQAFRAFVDGQPDGGRAGRRRRQVPRPQEVGHPATIDAGSHPAGLRRRSRRR